MDKLGVESNGCNLRTLLEQLSFFNNKKKLVRGSQVCVLYQIRSSKVANYNKDEVLVVPLLSSDHREHHPATVQQ